MHVALHLRHELCLGNTPTAADTTQRQPFSVRVWASLRGQTLCRTAFGMAEYEEALLLQAQAEQPGLARPAALELVRTKFEMLFACQNYGDFKRNGEAPAADGDAWWMNAWHEGAVWGWALHGLLEAATGLPLR